MNNHSNKVKQLLKENRKVNAAWVQSANAINAEILAKSGFDVLMIDLEHGPGDIMQLLAQVQAMNGYTAVPFARAMWNDFVHIKKVLDTGVYGVLVPYVNSADEARDAVKAVKYPPFGIRGIAGSPRAAGYGNNPMDYLKSANDEICLFIAIETISAVGKLDEILMIEGIDGIFIGPMDLATNMGYFGDASAPEVQKTILAIEQKVLASGKSLGTVAGSWDDAQAKYERGYRFIVSFSDTVSLGKFASQHVEKFNTKYPHR